MAEKYLKMLKKWSFFAKKNNEKRLVVPAQTQISMVEIHTVPWSMDDTVV